MLRNKEIRKVIILFAAITAAAAAAGFSLHPKAGILVLMTAAALGGLFFLFTKARYREIARLSEQIDLVLHHVDRLFISDGEEGELSILGSEIEKLTVRIREQNDALKQDKRYLADSLADIAHQLRTPLTSANLILSLLKNARDENERRSLLRETEALFVQMDWLLTALLKLSRLDAGIVLFQSGEIEVRQLVNASLGPFQIPMELHNITLQLDIPEGSVIRGDFGWLSEAFQNILKNCIESAGDGGLLHIACRDTPLFTELTFHDSGPGFKQEDIPFLFDRFYRGENKDASGYGIGLALCRTILVRQGGTVTAKNHPMGGAVFSVRFPKPVQSDGSLT